MSEATDIAALAAKAAGATIVSTADGRQFLVAPDGVKHNDVSNEHGLRTSAPRYVRQ